MTFGVIRTLPRRISILSLLPTTTTIHQQFCTTTIMANNKKKALLIVTDGAEEMETVITVDVLRRAEVLLFILLFSN